eukprot:evm.model.scf_440.6 EVM.evm.TU.scf_440.6   scf_440:39552-53991(-)
MKLSTIPNNGNESGEEPTEAMRNDLQAFLLGALSVLVVDRVCRVPLLEAEPDMSTLFDMCKDLPGYSGSWGQERRLLSAKTLTCITQRDHDVRMKIVENGRILSILSFLKNAGPPTETSEMMQFCMASILATIILDDEVMALVTQRKECHVVFEACLVLLDSTLNEMKREEEAPPGGHAEGELTSKQHLRVRLAEGCAQALWGAAYYSILDDAASIGHDKIVLLADMALEAIRNQTVPLGRVAHCISATLATFCSEEVCARSLMSDPDDGPLRALMILLTVEDTEVFRRAGHVRAAATTGLAFLSCHPLGAKGDDCLEGPFRAKLIEIGAFGGLLLSALEPPPEDDCRQIIQQSSAVGVMYLSTVAGDVEPAALAGLAALLNNSDNVEMVEYLMAAMWILLRNPWNRKMLGMAFNNNPANTMQRDINNKIHDAIDIHDVSQQADEVALISNQIQNSPGKPTSPNTQDTGGEGAIVVTSTDEARAADAPAAIKTDDKAKLPKYPSGTAGKEFADAAKHKGCKDSASSGGEGRGSGSPSRQGSGPLERDWDEGSQVSSPPCPEGEGLAEDWGLETLVRVGENWLPRILELNVAMDRSDAPLVKLFEFLTASMCLFLVGDEDELAESFSQVFEFGSCAGSKSNGWWTIKPPQKELQVNHPELVERALFILTQLLHLSIPRAWKTIQLSCVTLWHVSARSPEIEKRVVEMGVCVALLDISNSVSWPASLRNCTSGHLQNLAESWRNIAHMGGFAPYLWSLVKLVDSRTPLLELTGAQGLARSTFHVPEGCPTPWATMDNIKAGIAEQDGVRALVALLQRINKRYQLLMDGAEIFAPRSPIQVDVDDDPTQYERPMNNLEAVIESYHTTMAALLNLSTLRLNQLRIGKRGLFTLLGTNCLLAAKMQRLKRCNGEEKLIDLCSAIIHNLALHPQNRTRLYKAELRGSLTLGRHLGLKDAEGMWQCEASGKFSTATSPKAATGLDPFLSFEKSLQEAVLKRPKVAFAPIMDHAEAERRMSPLGKRKSVLLSGIVGAVAISNAGKSDHGPEADVYTVPGRQSSAALGTRLSRLYSRPSNLAELVQDLDDENPRKKFMHWMESTFVEAEWKPLPEEEIKKSTFRLPIVDRNGDWANERASMRSINSLLQRPLCHTWKDVRELQSTSAGQDRWHPAISEYFESKKDLNMGPTAGKLLYTGRFSKSQALQSATMELAASGRSENMNVTFCASGDVHGVYCCVGLHCGEIWCKPKVGRCS